MILIIECAAACIIFSLVVVGSTLVNKTAWLHEYAPEVQKAFLSQNPDYSISKEKQRKMPLAAAKCLACVLFTAVLSFMAYAAGAKSFLSGMIYSYIIWFAVNIFDVFVLDLGIFAHWKKIRLPGTEDMDKEYASNAWKSIKDGIWGILIGVPVAFLCGVVIMIIEKI